MSAQPDSPAVLGSKRERREASTLRLLETAIELISEQGFERTSATEIGERAGYSRSMVRSRYGTKEALLESLLKTEYEPRLLPTGDEDGDGLHRALAQVDRTRDAARENPRLLRAFFTLCFETVGPLSPLRPWMRDWLARCEEAVEVALRAGISDGSVRPSIDTATESRRAISDGLSLGFRWLLDPDDDVQARLRAMKAELIDRWTAET